MKFHHRLRVRLIALLSMALLFSQLAVAAYACPAMNVQPTSEAAAMAGMPCAEMMAAGVQLDAEQPTLCMQHCQFGSASPAVDAAPLVLVSPMALPPLFTVVVDAGPDEVLSAWAEDERLPDRPPPLAHSIAHCCFRF